MRWLYITYWLLGLCHVFGHRWGYKPFWTDQVDSEGWFSTPLKKRKGRICSACAALEERDP